MDVDIAIVARSAVVDVHVDPGYEVGSLLIQG